jgi:hypothetical protein
MQDETGARRPIRNGRTLAPGLCGGEQKRRSRREASLVTGSKRADHLDVREKGGEWVSWGVEVRGRKQMDSNLTTVERLILAEYPAEHPKKVTECSAGYTIKSKLCNSIRLSIRHVPDPLPKT